MDVWFDVLEFDDEEELDDEVDDEGEEDEDNEEVEDDEDGDSWVWLFGNRNFLIVGYVLVEVFLFVICKE